tara:strand:+ start:117 stop:353 length:237 start_codon:yes stop_codon:yes gene_type:complete
MKYYYIVDISDLNNIVWDEVVENKDTIRYNVAKDKFLVKHEGNKPACLNDYSSYTREEITTIINNESNGWFVSSEDWN